MDLQVGALILRGACVLALAATVVLAQPQLPAAHFVSAWRPLRLAQLTPGEIRLILIAVEQTSFDTPDSWEDELQVGRAPGSAAELLLVRGTRLLCGATGNCQVWVFVRSRDRWLPAFSQQAPMASGVGLADQVNQNVNNLLLVTHLGGQKDRYTQYRFDGKLYRVEECFDVESPGGSRGTTRVTKVQCP